MYSIEYYKTKKVKPEIHLDVPIVGVDDPIIRYQIMKNRRLEKDYIDTCWNVKSLTIDLNDINNIRHEFNEKRRLDLLSLFVDVRKIEIPNDINSIKILKTNNVNKIYIYNILKCDWMLNMNTNLDDYEELLRKAEDERNMLYLEYEKYNVENKKDFYDTYKNQLIRNNINKRIHLIEYYIDSLKRLYTEQIEEQKYLKLGRKFYK